MRLILIAMLVLGFGRVAIADCTNPAAPEGVLLYNEDQNVPQYCDGTQWVAMARLNPSAGGRGCTGPSAVEGVILYNSTHHVPQYCDGDVWKSLGGTLSGAGCTNDTAAQCVLEATRANDDPDFTAANIANGVNILGVTGTHGGSSGCTAPSLCPNVGNVCDDGNAGNNPDPKFAGFMLYGSSCEAIFAPQADQDGGSARQWKTSTGGNDIATDDWDDGKVNDGQIADSTTFMAFKTCKDLTYGGFTDWYLPARQELNTLYKYRTEIGGFATANYWSSTEWDNTTAWARDFNSGSQPNLTETNSHRVRCARRP